MNITPPNKDNPAAELIRQKIAKLYSQEPDARTESAQAEAVKPRSKHQQFMHELNQSGKSMAHIQTEWHAYYTNLDDKEKHEVWQEFYASSNTASTPKASQDAVSDAEKIATIRNQLNANHVQKQAAAKRDTRSANQIQHDIRKKVKKPTSKFKQQLQSIAFGLGVGAVALVIFLFSFFNEVIIAPLIQPARSQQATPLILASDTVAPSDQPEIIIPKINVKIPIVFDVASAKEDTMQDALDKGIAHYPTTADPGQNGNSAYFGHSSNNIFNKGDYKFAFVLLNQLVPGDTFYITKDGKLYAYKVFNKIIVEPSQVEVLNPIEGHQATATLITCDPPGTTLRRLVVQADQITPDPSENTEADQSQPSGSVSNDLTGNGPTLWSQFIATTAGKIATVPTLLGVGFWIFRLINKGRVPNAGW